MMVPILFATSVLLVVRGVLALRQCDGVQEFGISWDVVREDLTHILQQVLEGALSRDLQASKDTKGRDPAVSYGDVQLHRHLERFRRLADILPGNPQCLLGRQSVKLFISALYSGLAWHIWFDRHQEDLAGIVHDANWTEVVDSGWPVLELLSVVALLHGDTDVSEECGRDAFESLLSTIDGPSAPLQKSMQALLRRPPCMFARAVALLGMAAADGRGASLARAQTAVRRAVGAGSGSSYALLTAPPLPALLSRLAVAQQRRHRSQASRLNVIYCGVLDIGDELARLCGGDASMCNLQVQVVESKEETRAQCYSHYREAVAALSSSTAPRGSASGGTLLVSPFLWQWRPELRRDLQRLVREQAVWRKEISVVGLPCLNSSRIWNWPVRRLRHEFWKLAYTEYATGHETSPYMPLAQFWAVGDTTSATRIYQTPVLLRLLDLLAQQEQEYSSALPGAESGLQGSLDVAEFFVELDLLSKQEGVRAYTLLQGSALEEDYKARAVLSPHMARTFHVESARFLGSGEAQRTCLFPSSSAAAAFTQQHGVVVSWCTRKALYDMFRDVGRWWLSLSPREHIIVPVSASVLNLFRSGDKELFPWDADIDANFIASHPLVLGSFLEEHREHLRSLGYTFILRGDRAVFLNLKDTARMDIWLSGPQDVSAFDIRARLCGVRVNFFRDQLEGSVWYYRPGEKIYGNTQGKLLHCKWEGHNACLPDCVRDGLGVGHDGCEFADRFVHLDT